MNRDDIIRWAMEATASVFNDRGVIEFDVYDIERFAHWIAATEREACARVCEETTASWTQHLYNEGCIDCAKAIRARGEK